MTASCCSHACVVDTDLKIKRERTEKIIVKNVTELPKSPDGYQLSLINELIIVFLEIVAAVSIMFCFDLIPENRK